MKTKYAIEGKLAMLDKFVRDGHFNSRSKVWVVVERGDGWWTYERYGFTKAAKDGFFTDFMDKSLRKTIAQISFDRPHSSGNVDFVNFYMRDLEPGEETNITIELMETIAKGWDRDSRMSSTAAIVKTLRNRRRM